MVQEGEFGGEEATGAGGEVAVEALAEEWGEEAVSLCAVHRNHLYAEEPVEFRGAG